MVLEALVLDALAEITASQARGRALEAEHGLLRHRLVLMAQSRAGLNGLEAEGAHHQGRGPAAPTAGRQRSRPGRRP